MKTLRSLSHAAIVLMVATLSGCSGSGDSILPEPQLPMAQTGQAKTYTMTVEASMGGGDESSTRALELDGSTLTAKWTNGDVVKVYTAKIISASRTRGGDSGSGGTGDNGSGTGGGVSPVGLTVYTEVGTLTASDIYDDGLSAKLSGSVTLEGEKQELYFFYGTASYDYRNQKGTLSDVSDHYDRASASIGAANYYFEGNTILTDKALNFSNQQAIVKFILQDQNGETVSTDNLSIVTTGDKNTFDIAYEATTGATTKSNRIDIIATSPLSEFYVAIPAINVTNGTLCLESQNTPDYYNYEKTATAYPSNPVIFANSKYYEVTVKMKRTINLSELSGEDTDYTAVNGDVLTGSIPLKYHLSIASGAKVTLSNVIVNDSSKAGITCLGNATIKLTGENSISTTKKDYPGIQVAGTGTTLTIEGDGQLTVNMGDNATASGIGSKTGSAVNNIKYASGNITINSGTIIAIAGNEATGIGCGKYSTCGDITINGGNIKAIGVTGIGATSAASVLSSCGNITITNGTIEAKGLYNPGIGCGKYGSMGTISITGGSVKAEGGDYAAGIGSSGSSNNSNINCNAINISGGQVETVGGSNAAGIGTGQMGNCGVISITGGTIKATGGTQGAGIGSGDKGICGGITITGGVVEAIGQENGAGIGGGYEGNCNDISIGGGQVKAVGGSNAAGIGSGIHGKCGDITITGGEVEATGQRGGAGIGSGYSAYFKSISISKDISSVKAVMGSTIGNSTPAPIGKGGFDNGSGTVTVDGVENWAGASTTNLNCSVTTTTIENDTWTLTPTPNN